MGMPNFETVDVTKQQTWNDMVPTYLALIDDFFSYSKNNEKVKTLFVEGKVDKEFFEKIFPLKINDIKRETPYIFKGNFYKAKWEGENTIILFGNPYLKEELKAKNINYKEIKSKANKITKNLNDTKVLNCKFVEEVGKILKEKLETYKNIKGFGFADRDFYDEEYIQSNQYSNYSLSYTLCHDFETSIFYLFFPYICEKKVNKNQFFYKLGRVLWLTVNQGFLEKFSKENPSLMLKHFSRENFYNDEIWEEINKKYGKGNLFNFEMYIEEYFGEKGELLKKFEDFNKELNSDYYSHIKNWIEKKQPNKRMDEIFYYSNGHLLWKHFILNLGSMFGVNNEDELTDMFINYISDNKEKLFDNPPLSLYLEFLEND